ncbi:receptor expression-enhancing protein 4 [Caerostris extrusa]|uniref:Receptor expression-enhancing protein n=1 Tax=Caerostris extrusa TaxID=172846 RepID=A0AAV4VYH4_CAEEX|nr:receptor expression-enhancing protein 4 [Caerostris extrusa]
MAKQTVIAGFLLEWRVGSTLDFGTEICRIKSCRVYIGDVHDISIDLKVLEYVKWMMYWIIFALFTCVETFADILVSFWLPFYYEMKILFVLWLLSPATRGSSVMYRRFVHPQLTKREKEIDDYIAKARDQGYNTVLQLGTKGLSYATAVVMQTALKGQETLVQHLRKSYSMNDLVEDVDGTSQHFATSASATNSLDETDSGSDERHKPLRHRWSSEGILSEDEKLAKRANSGNKFYSSWCNK